MLHHSPEGGSFMPGAVLCSSLEFWQLQYYKHLKGITTHWLQWKMSVVWMCFNIYLGSGNSSSVSFRKCLPELLQRLLALTYDPRCRTCATLDSCWLGNLKNLRVTIKKWLTVHGVQVGGFLPRNRTPLPRNVALENSNQSMSSLFTAAFSWAPSVDKVLFVSVATKKEWIVWRDGVFCHRRGSPAHRVRFPGGFTLLLLSRIVALQVVFFGWAQALKQHSANKYWIYYFLCNSPSSCIKYPGHFFFSSVTWEQHRRDPQTCSIALWWEKEDGTSQFSLSVQQNDKNRQIT